MAPTSTSTNTQFTQLCFQAIRDGVPSSVRVKLWRGLCDITRSAAAKPLTYYRSLHRRYRAAAHDMTQPRRSTHSDDVACLCWGCRGADMVTPSLVALRRDLNELTRGRGGGLAGHAASGGIAWGAATAGGHTLWGEDAAATAATAATATPSKAAKQRNQSSRTPQLTPSGASLGAASEPLFAARSVQSAARVLTAVLSRNTEMEYHPALR